MASVVSRDFSYEVRWQERWEESSLFRALRRAGRPKWFIVELPPFANGRLHLGHARNYMTADVIARFRRAIGFDVLYTTGFDSFGLPNEIAAREEGLSPAKLVSRNQPVMAAQLARLGLSHDRTRVLSDHEPEYYRWVQWIFLRLREAGYAVRRKDFVYWCSACGATLAESLVDNGRCWRCRTQVARTQKEQWFIREPDFAAPLLDQELPGWPEAVLAIHRDWIGRRVGVEADFRIEGRDDVIAVFAQSREALLECRFLGIAPASAEAERLGVASVALENGMRDAGLTAIEPLSGRRVPVILCKGERHAEQEPRLGRPEALPQDRLLFDKLSLERRSGVPPADPAPLHVRPAVRMRLRDWDITRSRYWGAPTPIVHCPRCGEVPAPDADLPVLLPEEIEIEPGANPLETCESFVDVACPSCSGPARRDTDTFESYSSPWWYYLICREDGDAFPFRSEGVRNWMPVDLMIGGADQARTCFFHLRTLAEAMARLGIVDERQPVRNLIALGMVKASGRKMSKSAGNSVDPAPLVERYGADALRLAVVSAAAPDQDFNWSDDLVLRSARFLSAVRRFFADHAFDFRALPESLAPSNARRRRLLAWTAAAERKAIASLERNAVHVAAREVVVFAGQLVGLAKNVRCGRAPPDDEALAFAGRALLRLLSPFAPHLAEELWARAHGETLLAAEVWPSRRETLETPPACSRPPIDAVPVS